ncbi:sulfate transport system substrate-binding protein [Hoyosella altamirensis]|uniref:Sulfate transport system substrate-binding protein n=1 Tax=Hoyosella altamirensis TaxID=616997 RepID=A0A839RSC5_9ACTN|nr:sulfate ABC transporter substrate-binding protein [Hoyosella altamirensis]MBB3039026.1 sulfate transport system substrate-binding protein [Hoyosella altamirensis]
MRIRWATSISRQSAGAVAALLGLALLAAGCAGGPSDIPGQRTIGGDGTRGTLGLFAYAVPKIGFDEVIPEFADTPEGEGVAFLQSFGASADQSRKVANGAPADVVNFSVEPDVTRLVDAGLVAPNWNDGKSGGIPFGSMVTFVVREGNPLNIQTWEDLVEPGVEVVTPNPFSSGSAKWNLLAPYAVMSRGGEDPQRGLQYVRTLIQEHIKIQPGSSREATEAFLQGRGDVLLTYENEAIFLERLGDPIEFVTPDETLRIENPMAIIENSPNRDMAEDFLAFQFSPEGQRTWARAGFRPADPAIRAEFENVFPQPETVWGVDDFGGWKVVNTELFDPDNGAISTLYYEALR